MATKFTDINAALEEAQFLADRDVVHAYSIVQRGDTLTVEKGRKSDALEICHAADLTNTSKYRTMTPQR